jgi:hypothetical protein
VGAVGAWLFDWGTTTTILVGAGMFVLLMGMNVVQAWRAAHA